MARVEVNGVAVQYVESGSGEPLVLLHGANADRRQFDWFRPMLGAGIRAIAYDQRDSPESVHAGPYTMDDHADDAARLIDKLCGGPAHIFGTSYGGAVAMTLAIRHPSSVKSLVLGATAASSSDFRIPDVAAVAARGEAAVQRFLLEQFFTPEAINSDAALMAAVRESTCERSPESRQRRMAALFRHDVRDRLASIQAPTIVLHGEQDPVLDLESSRALAETIPGAELVVLPGVRHAVSMERAEHVARVISEFVLKNA